jgi:hypothetical protein
MLYAFKNALFVHYVHGVVAHTHLQTKGWKLIKSSISMLNIYLIHCWHVFYLILVEKFLVYYKMNFMYGTTAVNYWQECEIMMKPVVYVTFTPPPKILLKLSLSNINVTRCFITRCFKMYSEYLFIVLFWVNLSWADIIIHVIYCL